MMEWIPAASADVVNVTVLPVIVTMSSVVVPSRKLTVPVAAAGTVAVKVTALPKNEGLGEEVRVIVGVIDVINRVPGTKVKS